MTLDTAVPLGRWRSLLVWARGRRAPVPGGSTVFTAERGTLALPMMFGVATLIEMAVLHLLIPWLWLSAVLAALSLASLVVLASTLAKARVHPHVLSSTSLALRLSGNVVATVDRKLIVSARLHRRFGIVSPALDGRRLILPNQDGTTVDIELSSSTVILVDSPVAKWRIDGIADSLSIQVDEPAALVAALNRTAPRAVPPTGDTPELL